MAERTKSTGGPRGKRGERGVRGQRGARGPRGKRGEKGERGESTSLQAVARMAQELEAAQRELRIQFTRIAQLQAALDSLRSELKSRPQPYSAASAFARPSREATERAATPTLAAVLVPDNAPELSVPRARRRLALRSPP